MITFPKRLVLTSLFAVLALGALAAGERRANAQITGLATDNSASSGSVSVGTAQNICTTSVLGTVAPLGGNVGESRNIINVTASNATSFTTRFVADLCTDSGGSTISSTLTFSCSPGGNSQSLTAAPRINFGVNAPAGTNYRLTVSHNAFGEVDFNNDGGNAASGNVSNMTTSLSGSSQFGGGSLNLATATGGGAFGASSGNIVYTGAGSGGSTAQQIASSWSAACSTPENGQECGIRIGLPCSITGGASVVGDTTFGPGGLYPGSPARTQATDGEFVSVGLEFCGDGIIQQDGVLNEQCDQGQDPVTGNGGTNSCCTINCQVVSNGTPCRAAAGECDITDVCNGISPVCGTDFKKANNTACTDDGNPCSKDVCDGVDNACQHPPGNAGALCRASVDLTCDPEEVCTGASTTCPADVRQPTGHACPSDGNPCTQDICDSSSGTCTHPAGNSGALCRAATDTCDAAETCTGTSTACPPDGVKPNGTACPDDGKLCTHDVCNGTSKACTHPGANAGEVCRPAFGDGSCDFDEVCDGTNPDCPPDVIAGPVRCRDEQGPCDVPEYCTGTSNACPPDGKQPVDTICRPAIGGADGACDVAEVCDGVTNDCPPDGLQPVGTICRQSTGDCDTAETCDGLRRCAGGSQAGGVCTQDADCGLGQCVGGPTPGAPCGSAGDCGSGPTGGTCPLPFTCAAPCPVDQLAPSTVVCRDVAAGAAGICDVPEYCTGTFKDCPFDQKVPAFSLNCRPSAGVCDVAEYCDGSDNTCPPDTFAPPQPCRAVAGFCDIEEDCTGTQADCPADAFQPTSLVCRSVADVCDIAEHCTGSNADCPADSFKTTATVCRGLSALNPDCDVEDSCTGTNASCPPDVKKPDGTLCVGGNPNTCLNACVTGVCTNACPGSGDLNHPAPNASCPVPGTVVVPFCCGNGVVDPGEQCDDGNQLSGGDACPSLPSDDCQLVASGGLIRGNIRNPATDKGGCQVEYSVLNPGAAPDKFGAPSNVQICEDQDPTCDLDPRPGRCRFHVVACLNNLDPDLKECTPEGLNSLVISNRPYLRKTLPQLTLVGANVATLSHSLQALFDPATPQLGFSLSPPLTPAQVGLCSGGMLIDVYAGSTYPRQSAVSAQRFSVKSRNNHLPRNRRNTSSLTLQCTARPVP